MLPLQVRRYSAFPKAPALLIIKLFNVISRSLIEVSSYTSAEMQLVYSTAPDDWAKNK